MQPAAEAMPNALHIMHYCTHEAPCMLQNSCLHLFQIPLLIFENPKSERKEAPT